MSDFPTDRAHVGLGLILALTPLLWLALAWVVIA